MSLNMELGLLVTGGELPSRFYDHLLWLVEEGKLVPVARD